MTKLGNILLCVVLLLGLLVIAGCENDYPASLYDPNDKGNPTPVINSVEPADIALAGVTTITINGTNFSPEIAKDIVYFNAAKGTILEASEARLVVQAPIYSADSVLIRVAVQGAELFGAYNHAFRLEPAQQDAAKWGPNDVPWACTTDAEGSIYSSFMVGAAGVGIKKIDLDGVVTDYAPKGGETKYSAMKMGPGGIIYAARIVKAIFQVQAGQKGVAWVSSGIGTIVDLDFDSYKNLWGVGNNDKIYRIKPDKSVKAFDFKANLRTVRIFDNFVYAAGNMDGVEKVWRFPITGNGEVGAVEEYFNYSTAVGSTIPVINAINFALDGTLYIGTDAAEAIFLVSPSKTMTALYPGQFKPKTVNFSWGKDAAGNYIRLIAVREATDTDVQSLFWINTQKEGAPYYGIL